MDSAETINGVDLVKNSLLYRALCAEREEIKTHKWIESQKEGRDVGFDWALFDWNLRHGHDWRKSHTLSHTKSIEHKDRYGTDYKDVCAGI